MKRPLFDMIERQIMIEDDSLYASRLHLAIATYRFKREIDRFLEPVLTRLNNYLFD